MLKPWTHGFGWLCALTILALLGLQPSLAAPPLAGTRITSQATATYKPDGWAQTETTYSAPAMLEVLPVEMASLAGESWLARAPGTGISVPWRLSNLGNVTSSFTAVAQNAGSCNGQTDTTDVAKLQVVVDANSNGVADPAELAAGATVALAAGQTASLLVLGEVPLARTGGACVSLTATTGLHGLSRSASFFISIADNPVVQLIKSASYAQALQRGDTTSRARYTISLSNIGTRAATRTATASGGESILIHGIPASVVLVRDVLPAGAQYQLGSWVASHSHALKLFRLASDPAFSYRIGDDAAAAEVALALPADLLTGQTLSMGFDVVALAGAGSQLRNVAQAHYGNVTGLSGATSTDSNAAIVPVAGERIGVSHWVVERQVQRGANTQNDGTLTYTLAVRVRNEGDAPLFNLQLPQILAGTSTDRWGSHTANAVPATGQYTVVPGSLAVLSGTQVSINRAFTGVAGQHQLLGSGVQLPVGAEFTLHYQVRVNAEGRAQQVIQNQLTAQASLHAYSTTPELSDRSTDGPTPDPDGDGDASNNSAPTLITLPNLAQNNALAAGLSITMTSANPVRVSPGVYELNYTLNVVNRSAVRAENVRVISNVACLVTGSANVAQASLVGRPTLTRGVLSISSAFSDQSSCDPASDASTDPNVLPPDPRTALNNGAGVLNPGDSEELHFKVRVHQTTPGAPTEVRAKAWLASMQDNSVTGSAVVAATSVTASQLLVDPQGYVYDSRTRSPVAGATVTLQRLSCENSTAGPITADQILNGDNGQYTYNSSDRSVSIITGADGQYQFFWKVPPIADICTYSITAQPAAGSPYVQTATLLPENGVFTGCGQVVAVDGIPTGAQPTTWYRQFRSGYRAAVQPPDCPVFHNNLPLDPSTAPVGGLLLSKKADKRTAEIGDFVDYELTLVNQASGPLNAQTLVDLLPAGFSYVPGSSTLQGVRMAEPQRLAPASPRERGSLVFKLGGQAMPTKASLTLRYRAAIGVGAIPDAEAVNTALATTQVPGTLTTLQSNTAQASVRVSGGVFSTRGFAVGRVYLDCNANGLQDGPDEPGIPGVRLYMEDGTSVITDNHGRWSLYGLKPITHVLRLDRSTLPVGAQPVVSDNRNAGVADSRFLDVKNGELVRADFAVGHACQDAAVRAQIEERLALFAKTDEQQLQALATARLSPTLQVPVQVDSRSMPASGAVGGTAALGLPVMTTPAQDSPLIALPGRLMQGLHNTGASAAPLPAGAMAAPTLQAVLGTPVPTSPAPEPPARLVTPSTTPLEDLIRELPARAAFLGLSDGDTLLTNQASVRVTGPQQSQLYLSLNGRPVPDNRVGKKSVVVETGLVAHEYIGIEFQPGLNQLLLEATDEFGNVRDQAQIQVRAPGEVAHIDLRPLGPLHADPMRPARLRLQLSDAAGVPIVARTAVTLDVRETRWLNEDLNPHEPGVQLFVEGGTAELLLLPPGQPGTVNLRASVGTLYRDDALTFLPAMAPLQGIGIVEGVLDLSKAGRLPLGQPQAGNAFEAELSSLGGNDSRATGRAAFYFKGTILGEYLLTAAFDSDKKRQERQFRDIKPDEFYPVYGDNAARGFDAQSSQQLYVRIDKNRSFLLLGDFSTASSAEVRQLSQYSRTLSGVQHRYDDGNARITSFVAETQAAQQIEEIPANGLSFYTLNSTTGEVRNASEKVELIVRDRRQPSLVLSVRTLARSVDYSFEPISRRLTLAQPLSTFDMAFNPQSLRITYELDNGGPSYTVWGTDAQYKLTERIQLGAVVVRDDNPANHRDLHAATALVRLGEATALAAEVVQTTSDLKGTGQAARAALRHDGQDLKAQLQVQKSGNAFDNASAMSSTGRTEANASAQYAFSPSTQLRAEALLTRTEASGTAAASERSHVGLAVLHKLSDTLAIEAGVRHGNARGGTASGGFDYGQLGSGSTSSSPLGSLGAAAPQSATPEDSTTMRVRVIAQPTRVPRLQLTGELEQDVKHKAQHALTVGAQYGLTDKTRLYAQHAVLNTLSEVAPINGQALRSATVVGVDSAYMEGGRLYNEYRANSNAAAQNASGVRNTFRLNERWSLNAGVERVTTLGSVPGASTTPTTTPTTTASQDATAVVLGLDYAAQPWRLGSAFEKRHSATSDASLVSLVGVWRLHEGLSLLGRSLMTRQSDSNGGHNDVDRWQVGMAWRPAFADRWNILSRYEHRVQDVAASSGISTTGANASVGVTTTDIVSTHAHLAMDRNQQLSLRFAAKSSALAHAAENSTARAQLVHSRYTRNLSPNWDLGLQAGLMRSQGGARQATAGMELGYQLMKNVWLSAGYNVLGLREPDLTGQNYTHRGAYLRIRLKFDETAFAALRH
ncbi:hypothetical protein B9Z31_13570 [Limnohabitans sp. G3-2]|nr:hypothetical protein B9Z31_13570 [Limnohabitans sp. G3-2]